MTFFQDITPSDYLGNSNEPGVLAFEAVNERALNIRAFTESQKRAAYERQKRICAKCRRHFEFEEM